MRFKKSFDIDAVRVGDMVERLLDGYLRGEMNDRRNAGDRPVQQGSVEDTAFEEPEPPAPKRRDAVDIGAGAGGEIVEADHRLAVGEEMLAQIGADEPGGAGHEPSASRSSGHRHSRRRQ